MIKNFFEIHHEDKNSCARTGVVHLAHGDVQTPVFMPVGTKGTVKALTKDDLEEIGFEIILAKVVLPHPRVPCMNITCGMSVLFLNLCSTTFLILSPEYS